MTKLCVEIAEAEGQKKKRYKKLRSSSKDMFLGGSGELPSIAGGCDAQGSPYRGSSAIPIHLLLIVCVDMAMNDRPLRELPAQSFRAMDLALFCKP